VNSEMELWLKIVECSCIVYFALHTEITKKGYSFFTHTVHEACATILVERDVNCVHVQLSIHIGRMTRIF
jgi:hypothetical protein